MIPHTTATSTQRMTSQAYLEQLQQLEERSTKQKGVTLVISGDVGVNLDHQSLGDRSLQIFEKTSEEFGRFVWKEHEVKFKKFFENVVRKF